MGCGAASRYKVLPDDTEGGNTLITSGSSASMGSKAAATQERASSDNLISRMHSADRTSLISFNESAWEVKPSIATAFTTKITDDYDVQKWSNRIGKGASGSVYRVVHRESGEKRAVKKCYKVREDDVLAYKREAILMGSLDHPNIIKIFETYEDRRCNYFVLELCEGGELLKQVTSSTSFTEAQCAFVLAQILQGVTYLHSQHICHRDLKPENFIMLDEKPLEQSTLKIIDFGSAASIAPGSFLETPTGTPAYMAPEVLAGQYNCSCDLWSFGVVAYFLLSGVLPVDIEEYSSEDLYHKLELGTYSLEGPEWQYASNGAKDFVAKCMTFNPDDRIRAGAALRHEWLSEAGNASSTVKIPVLQNLSTFWNASKQKTTALYDVSGKISSDSCQRLQEGFASKDVDGHGKLSIDDVTSILQEAGLELPEEHIAILVRSWDADGDGQIDYDEFVVGMQKAHSEVEEEICMAAFRKMDGDGNGLLSQDELTVSRKDLMKILTEESVIHVLGASISDDIMKVADTDGDGKISFDEFMVLVTGRNAERYGGKNK